MVTDHNPLVHLQTQPNLSRRQARWAEYLQRFNFKWTYRPGRTNAADPLSRVPHEPVKTLVLNAIALQALTRTRARATVEHALHVDDAAAEGTPAAAPAAQTITRKQKRGAASAQLGQRREVLGGKQAQRAAAAAAKSGVHGLLPDDLQVLAPQGAAPQDKGLMAELARDYAHDEWFAQPSNTADLQFKDGLWWMGNRVAVPDVPGLRRSILYELHDAPYSGHAGEAKTLKAVQNGYWWPSWRADVKQYVATCTSCQRNKSSNQPLYGLLNPFIMPERPWSSVGIDFVGGLPDILDAKGDLRYNAIIVFMDRLAKIVHLAPKTTEVDAAGTAWLLTDYVIKHHGVPDTIITDRGSVFTSDFFEEVLRLLGTRRQSSTVYHPQTDGQTERVNRVLGDMLRHYAGLQQYRWHVRLPAAEFAINIAYQESIGTTLFRLNGRDPNIPMIRPPAKEQSAAHFADRMIEGLQQAKRCLQAAQDRQKL